MRRAVTRSCSESLSAGKRRTDAYAVSSVRKALELVGCFSAKRLDASNLPANAGAAMDKAGRERGLPRLPMPPSSAQQEKLIREALGRALMFGMAGPH